MSREEEAASLVWNQHTPVQQVSERTQPTANGLAEIGLVSIDVNSPAPQAARRRPLDEIASNPGLRLRLELWENEDTLLRDRIERKEQSLNKTQNEIYQLFGFYFVFQGVILTALSQSSTLECGNWWIPFLLVVFADVGVKFAVWYKLRRCDDINAEIAQEKENSRAVKKTMQSFLGLGSDYDPDNLDHHAVARRLEKKTKILWKIVITVAITAFSSIIAQACHTILCDGKKCKKCEKCS